MEFLLEYKFERVSEKVQDYKNYQIEEIENKNNENLLETLKEFENKNFIDKSSKEIESLCAKINQIYSKKLGIKPAIIEYLPWCNCGFMQTFTDRNYVQISEEFFIAYRNNKVIDLSKNQVGYFYLYGILHETFHTYQNYNLYQYFNGKQLNKKDLQDYLESMIVEFRTKGYSYFEQLTFYSTDLTEFRANQFAISCMIELANSGYLNREECVKFLKLHFKKYVRDAFCKDNVNFTKKAFKINFEQFKEIKRLDDNSFSVIDTKNLKNLCNECENIDIDKLYEKTLTEIKELEKNINSISLVEEQLVDKHTN